jgi:hypothetical protein
LTQSGERYNQVKTENKQTKGTMAGLAVKNQELVAEIKLLSAEVKTHKD